MARNAINEAARQGMTSLRPGLTTANQRGITMAVTDTTMISTAGRAAEPTVSHQIAGSQRDGNLNRRKVLQMTTASIATAAAVTPPSAVKALAGLPSSNPDAELLDLGRHLVALFEEYAVKSEECDQANAAWVPPQPAESLEVTSADLALIGVPGTVSNRHWTHWAIKQKLELMRDNPQAVARLTELHRYADEADEVFCRSRGECGLEAAVERQSEVCRRMEALTARIRKLPATTFAGLAVKALHLTFDTSLFDEEPDDMDWDQYCLRVFATEMLTHLPDDMHCPRLTEALADKPASILPKELYSADRVNLPQDEDDDQLTYSPPQADGSHLIYSSSHGTWRLHRVS
jgi:hypothetical protein